MSKRQPAQPRRRRSGADSGNRIRVRGKRLDQVDNTKLALAYWLLAKRLVEDKTDPRLPNEAEVREAAKDLDEDAPGQEAA